ncbi:MAG: LacI family transcriptional regulator [Mucilaginibacter sp.]|nr:LacI family transcriptional regulator [Mucilaginibacter sp.]
MDALKQYNYEVDEDLIIECDLSPDKVKIYINHLLKIKNPPDAIFCINDPSAIQAIQIIESMGMKIPEDIAIVGFSNDFASELIGLTTVAQPVKDIGCTAAQLLFDQIESDKKKAIIKQLKTKLIIRSSTVKSSSVSTNQNIAVITSPDQGKR